jgi:hypothetical protein
MDWMTAKFSGGLNCSMDEAGAGRLLLFATSDNVRSVEMNLISYNIGSKRSKMSIPCEVTNKGMGK